MRSWLTVSRGLRWQVLRSINCFSMTILGYEVDWCVGVNLWVLDICFVFWALLFILGRRISGVTRGGGQPGFWPRAQTKKFKKSHTKGRKTIFLKGRNFLRGRKNPDLPPGDQHYCYATEENSWNLVEVENWFPGVSGNASVSQIWNINLTSEWPSIQLSSPQFTSQW